VLVELGVVEQRYRAVMEVLEGAPVTEVAARYGVARQTVHGWLRRYAQSAGLGGLSDWSSRPDSCPHQMPAAVEAKIVDLRRHHPAWGAATILWHLEQAGISPLPGRSSIYRALQRHNLVQAQPRRRKREDYRRWERGRSMELWQMDVMGRVFLTDGREVKLVTGLDDHSRFIVCARVVERATARTVSDALMHALTAHGAPEQLLTDNGSVFTDRFGRGAVGPVMFDRVCVAHGIRHLLTAPYSPTTTGKVERLHKTIRAEFVREHDRQHATVEQLQQALDAWVGQYNTARPHQSCGNRPPAERFALAERRPLPATTNVAPPTPVLQVAGLAGVPVARRADARGRIKLQRVKYPLGMTFAGEHVQVLVREGLVEVFHHGVLIATRAQRRSKPKATPSAPPRPATPRPAAPQSASSGPTVTRLVDAKGQLGFAGTNYGCGKQWAGQHVQITIVGSSVQFSLDGQVVRLQPIRHDRAKEFGAFARPNGIARKHTG
jgi:transposase InsO family protein